MTRALGRQKGRVYKIDSPIYRYWLIQEAIAEIKKNREMSKCTSLELMDIDKLNRLKAENYPAYLDWKSRIKTFNRARWEQGRKEANRMFKKIYNHRIRLNNNDTSKPL